MAVAHIFISQQADRIDAALREIRAALDGGETHLRFEADDLESATTMVRLVREAKKGGAEHIEIADDGRIIIYPKLRRALRMAGAEAFMPSEKAQESPESRRRLARLYVEYPGLLQHDYVVFNHRKMPGQSLSEAVLRLTYRCNERCHFCWLDQNQAEPTLEMNQEMIKVLAEIGVNHLAISGGEPTLVAELPDYIRDAKQQGIRFVTLQTNGTRLADSKRIRSLMEAGLDWVFLAVNSHRPDVSDAITTFDGGHKKTVKALRLLLMEGVPVVINHVITKNNVGHLVDFARFLVAETTTTGKAFSINFSVAAPMGRYERHFADHIPRISEIRLQLGEALSLLIGANILVDGFASPCGMPLCVVDDPTLLGVLETVDEATIEPDFIKSPVCVDCRLRPYCHGLRRPYAEYFGMEEVMPFPEKG